MLFVTHWEIPRVGYKKVEKVGSPFLLPTAPIWMISGMLVPEVSRSKYTKDMAVRKKISTYVFCYIEFGQGLNFQFFLNNVAVGYKSVLASPFLCEKVEIKIKIKISFKWQKNDIYGIELKKVCLLRQSSTKTGYLKSKFTRLVFKVNYLLSLENRKERRGNKQRSCLDESKTEKIMNNKIEEKLSLPAKWVTYFPQKEFHPP